MPTTRKRRRRNAPLIDSIDFDSSPTGCWLWTAGLNAYGYGTKSVDGSARLVHRMLYERLVGPIPDGLQIDHLCRNRACCNPRHLEAVTQRENLLRGDTVTARNAARTECPRGHPYSVENTGISRGARYCRTCAREKTARRRALKRSRQVAA